MSLILSRSEIGFDSQPGLLCHEHFQMAYVTNDADRACDLLGRQLGVKSFARLEGPTLAGGKMRAEFAWVGTLFYEIIEASGPGTEIFTDFLEPADGFAMRQHHLGFAVADAQRFAGIREEAARHGWRVPHSGENALTRYCFVEVPGLPHYLEYLLPTAAGLEFFAGVPRS